MQQIQIPSKILNAAKLWKRFLALYGGRGGAKSESIARLLLLEASENRHRILCGREFQNSISDSVKGILEDTIDLYKMPGFKVTDKYIQNSVTGSEFIFKGLKKESAGSLKSLNKITIAWIEEANYVSNKSLEILTPTIREKNSKVVFTFNLNDITDPVYDKFVITPRADTVVCKVNYYDNPWFADPLLSEMLYDKEHDYERYQHVWEGEPVQHSEDQVFSGRWDVKDFETPEDAEFFHGADWGFANDPTTGIRCFIKDDYLYIDLESYKLKLEITETGAYLLNDIPTFKTWKSLGDCSRPETISHLNRYNGFKMIGSRKGAGSIEEGIQKIRQFKKVFIHPRCKETIKEFRLYKWKKNRLTDENMPVAEDANNHIIDALRYALEPYDRQTSKIIIPDKRMF